MEAAGTRAQHSGEAGGLVRAGGGGGWRRRQGGRALSAARRAGRAGFWHICDHEVQRSPGGQATSCVQLLPSTSMRFTWPCGAAIGASEAAPLPSNFARLVGGGPGDMALAASKAAPGCLLLAQEKFPIDATVCEAGGTPHACHSWRRWRSAASRAGRRCQHALPSDGASKRVNPCTGASARHHITGPHGPDNACLIGRPPP